MTYFIGTDEAGYGPNLGPLLIAATVWRVPDDWPADQLYEQLDGVISNRVNQNRVLVLADSKSLYRPAEGIGLLETQVLAAARTAGISIPTWVDAWGRLAGESCDAIRDIPWYQDFQAPLPLRGSSEQAALISANTVRGLKEQRSAIERLRAVALFPARFNQLVEQFGNKAAVLSHVTIQLARELSQSLDDPSVLIHCDKHGGRNRYLSLLQHFFPDARIAVIAEGRQQSAYRWSDSGREFTIRFVAKGERFPPSALASMIAKYLRELAMHAFNAYWRQQIPQLHPTAGYPVDAKRFRHEIAEVQQALGISDHVLWRNR